MDFVQVSKILPANFWPFHCTVKLPYVKKITRLIGNSSRSLMIFDRIYIEDGSN